MCLSNWTSGGCFQAENTFCCVFLTKSQSFDFINEDSGAGSTQLTFLLHWYSRSPSLLLRHLKPVSSSSVSLPSTSCTSICPPDSLTLYGFSLTVLGSFPANWLCALPLDLLLTLFSPVYDTQSESSWIKGVCLIRLSHTTTRNWILQ